jgi:RNA-directed DNA polymerase
MQATSLANGTDRPTEWNSVNWRKANRQVRNLKQRIFRASQSGDWNTVRSLQKLMLHSYSNTLVSVRRVTQINQGRNTPGVDKLTVKTPEGRGRLVDHLMTFQPWKAKPAKRVYIPKANGKVRPLGIPTVIDRCLQARVKNALEPRWEAQFEASSYGFRPGRGCHDAIQKIYLLARPNKSKKWVVDADIKGAFDNIDHTFLLEIIGSVPGMELIKQWLKAGYVDRNVFHETDKGTPQGGVISPLLANIALHGMEEAVGVKYDNRGQINGKRAVVRYADDFVVFCESRKDAEKAKEDLTKWLAERGLKLSEEKTRIVHLMKGFDFLSYNVRHYRDLRARTGYKLLIKPSKDAVQRIRDKLRAEWLKLKGKPVSVVLRTLNPIIRGWANYHRVVVASKTFRSLDHWMYRREYRYVNHTHPNKPTKWKRKRYWGRMNKNRKDNWVFGDKRTGLYLSKFPWVKIERHVMVKGRSSPDDPSLRDYWKARKKAKAKELSPSRAKLAKNQGGTCPICGESLFNGEETQKDHVTPRDQGGEDSDDNAQLLHLYCHQQKTAMDRSKPGFFREWLRTRASLSRVQ